MPKDNNNKFNEQEDKDEYYGEKMKSYHQNFIHKMFIFHGSRFDIKCCTNHDHDKLLCSTLHGKQHIKTQANKNEKKSTKEEAR